MEKVFRPKFFSLLKHGFTTEQLSRDIMAGLVVGIVALPLAIAFAVASGVSPEKGIITGAIAGFIIALLGGSRVQIGGPTGAFVIIVFSIVAKYGINGLVISTIMAGIIMIIFGLLRLGALLKYFPHPLVIGFTSGIALVIFSIQVKDALGFTATDIPAQFISRWSYYASSLHSANLTAMIITVVTILVTVASKRFTKRVPGSFIAIVLISLLVAVAGLDVPTIGSFFGEIGGRIKFELPSLDFSGLGNYLQPALTIALLGSIESLLSAVVADGMISGNHRSNTELIAQGIANIVTPLFGGIPATGAIARTATNVKNGARTPVAGMVHSLTLLLLLLFFGRWASYIPMSCLAGILIVVAYNMSEWRSFTSLLKGSSFDIIVLLSTFFLTVLVDLTVAIEIGIVLSAFLFMKGWQISGTRDYLPRWIQT
ncbi:MAG: SulP family inorganic anion transporter [Bacteroidales bacterium]